MQLAKAIFGKRITHLAMMLAAAASLELAASPPAAALVITPSYDANWLASAPAAATTAVNNVISEYENDFSNPVTVTIQFDWGDLNGGSLNNGAASVFPSNDFLPPFGPQTGFTLAQVQTIYNNAAATPGATTVLQTAAAHIPASYPNPGCCGAGATSANFFIPDTEYLALTGSALNADTTMAYVGFATDFCGPGAPNCSYNYTAGNPGPNAVDFTAVAEHEIAHALSRSDYGFSSGVTGGAPPFLTPQDLLKYDCGTSTLDPNFSQTCFSYNGDVTNPGGKVFSDTSDSGDWLSCNDGAGPCPSTGDSYDAFIAPGETSSVSTADLQLMCAEGWNDRPACGTPTSTPVPEPASMTLIGSALLIAVGLRRRRRTEQS